MFYYVDVVCFFGFGVVGVCLDGFLWIVICIGVIVSVGSSVVIVVVIGVVFFFDFVGVGD